MTTFTVDERTTRLYQTTLKDENDAVFNGTAFTSLTVTLYDLHTDMVLNGRNAQSLLNANGGTVTGAGLFQWVVSDSDNMILDPTLAYEMHRALFTGLWNPGSGTRTWRHGINLLVRNLHRVP